jgi:hypothetical protein
MMETLDGGVVRSGFKACVVSGVLAMMMGSAAAQVPAAPGSPPQSDAAPAASPLGHGLTVEANLGVGWLTASNHQGQSADSDDGFGGLNVGVGGWIAPRVALSLRLASVTYLESDGRLTGGFVGGALQFWPTENFWLGTGLGVGFASLEIDDEPDVDPEAGMGFDLRLGYTPLIFGEHSLNVSLEVNPTFFDGFTLTGTALLVGYQFL